ncbi:phage tail tape measure protein [Paenibacillus radicis (ex Xue et al. 2023)]|uniref:Phage tail tape measure protein n=1 Tax=Paenibacillus radicis (ex Xue et al. 2023) TaxID=2972489 RepID=A0ABT1YTV0_9BACL|nr:phage tail tape measure protein [Paenibacillus radicis (ex Xue et al. 2023)]MCR8635744.1 phage tail tape measure protein [Paenibacillus radicis (ex Xue et al. 2023)]
MEIFRLFGSIFINDDDANKKMDGMDQKGKAASSQLGNVGKAAGAAALSLAAVGAAALAAFGVASVTAADDFNKSMNKLQAQTGASNEEMAAFKETAKELYNANLGESLDDVAKAMAEVKKTTGTTGEGLNGLTKNALILRDTFDYDVKDSVKAADSLMKQFGISGDQAFTLIAQGAQNGADRSGELLDSLNEYAPQFNALGFSADQFTNVLIDGAKNGAFQIDKVGDAVKEFNIRAKDGSKGTTEAFQALGLNADKTGKQFAAGGETAQKAFQTVLTAMKNLDDPMELNRIGVQLFGTQFEDLEAKSVLALGNIGTTANSTGDTLKKINDIKYSSFGEAITGIGRQLETGILIPVGEKVLPILNEFANWLSGNMPLFLKWFKDTFGGASDELSGFGKMWKALKDEYIKYVLDFIVPFIQEKLAAISAYWDENGADIQNTVETLFNLIMDIVKLTMPYVQDIITVAWDIIGTTISSIVDIVSGVIKILDGLFRGDFTKVWEGMQQTVKGIWEGIGGIVKGGVNLIIAQMNNLIRGLNRIKFDFPDWIPAIGGKAFSLDIPAIPMLAKGTDYFAGGMALVGEEGPELLNLPRGAKVTPNDQTMNLLQQQPSYIQTSVYLDGYKIAEAISEPLHDMTRQRGRGEGLV